MQVKLGTSAYKHHKFKFDSPQSALDRQGLLSKR